MKQPQLFLFLIWSLIVIQSDGFAHIPIKKHYKRASLTAFHSSLATRRDAALPILQKKRTAQTSQTPAPHRTPPLKAINNDNQEDATNNDANNLLSYTYGTMWAGQIIYSYGFGPGRDGTFFPEADMTLVAKLFDPAIMNHPPPGSGLGLLGLLNNSFLILPVVWFLLLQEEAISSRQRVPVWPFSVLSFGLGSSSLFLYMALRQPNVKTLGESFSTRDDPFLFKLSESFTFKAALIFVTILISLTFAIPYAAAENWQGEWEGFWHLFDTSQFVSTSIIDVILSNIFILDPMIADAKRRGLISKDASWEEVIQTMAAYSIPLFGPVAWIVLRPKILN